MFDLQGLLNLLFGYPLGFITTPYLDYHNKKIQDILSKNNVTLPNDNTQTDAQIIAYQTKRDDLTHNNTNGLDRVMNVLDSEKGLVVLLLSGVLYYFNKDKVSLQEYLLVMGGISLGGIVITRINKSNKDAKHNADLAALKASENTATHYGKPYSLDLTKIKTYPAGHYMAGELYYDDPKWDGLQLQKRVNGYYLGDGGVPQQQWFMYNLKDGSWSNTFNNPSTDNVPGNNNNQDGMLYSSNNQQ